MTSGYSGAVLSFDSLKDETLLHDGFDRLFPFRIWWKMVCAVLRLGPEGVRRPSKIRGLAQARGLICYLAIRELEYRGKEVGREPRIGPNGVSVAATRGERVILDKPELRRQVLFPE